MRKYIDADKLIAEIERRKVEWKALFDNGENTAAKECFYEDENILDFITSLQQEQVDMGEVSDGYHTFNELYYYRMLYNAAFFNLLPKEWVHKSKRHHTGEECFGGGWFIVMANLPTGQVSNHYELKDWDLFKVPEKEFADEWDGHTPQEAAERIHKYLQQEQPIQVNTLTWKDINDLERIINNVHYEFRNGIGEKSFGEEVLERFREERDEQEQPVKSYCKEHYQGYKDTGGKCLFEWNCSAIKQQEADLEKEIDSFFPESYFETSINFDDVADIARHFAEWGAIHLNVKKEE